MCYIVWQASTAGTAPLCASILALRPSSGAKAVTHDALLPKEQDRRQTDHVSSHTNS